MESEKYLQTLNLKLTRQVLEARAERDEAIKLGAEVAAELIGELVEARGERDEALEKAFALRIDCDGWREMYEQSRLEF